MRWRRSNAAVSAEPLTVFEFKLPYEAVERVVIVRMSGALVKDSEGRLALAASRIELTPMSPELGNSQYVTAIGEYQEVIALDHTKITFTR